jgi:cytochrome c biogenesis protein CcmG/thiol:disulfide interchange protein DsbE
MLLKVHRAGIVPVVGLDWRDDPAQASQWLKQLGNPYQAVAVDTSGREAVDWGVYAAPETFLVNPQGVVVYKQTGALTDDVWQREIVPRVVSRSAGS